MVAQALAPLAVQGSLTYVAMAGVLALGSGLLLMLMGLLRLGFLSQLLSRPVVQGFTVASAVLILLGQVAPVLGWGPMGSTVLDMWTTVRGHLRSDEAWHLADMVIGGGVLVTLGLARPVWSGLARSMTLPAHVMDLGIRLWPMLVLLLATGAASQMVLLMGRHPALVGQVSWHADQGPAWDRLTQLDADQWSELTMPILLIGLVGFVSSMSVAQTFALKRGERVDADRELLGLGLANLGATVLGGMPVTGGLSRSVVNEAAGARSPLAGIITALILAAVLLAVMPWMAWLPKAALAGVIIMAIANLIRLDALRAAWAYDRAEAWAFVSTALGVLFIGFEAGILLGMAWSLGAMIWRHSQPHVAEVGRLPGTAHFRNVERFDTEQQLPGLIMIRIDESLDFTNIQRVEQHLCELIYARGGIQRIVLLMSAVNHIDHTAMQALLELDAALAEQGKTVWLAEIKGPVMDRLQTCQLSAHFAGRMHVSAQAAWDAHQA
jgi:SulP family sulfate permease